MVVSTRRIIVLMSSSLVSFSMEIFSSAFSSPVTTSKVMLKAEISRAEAAIAQKGAQIDAASAIFKK